MFTVLINSSTMLADVDYSRPILLYDTKGGAKVGELACGHKFELLTDDGDWSEISTANNGGVWIKTVDDNGKLVFAPQGSAEAREAAKRRFLAENEAKVQ